jgi:large subunit ribosomal protein L30e
MGYEEKIKQALEAGNVIIGTKQVMKNIKNGKVEYVLYAQNCPAEIKTDLLRNAKIANVQVEEFNGTGKQLGIFMAKAFPVAVIGVKKSS